MAHLLTAKYSPAASTQRQARIANALLMCFQPDHDYSRHSVGYADRADLIKEGGIKFWQVHACATVRKVTDLALVGSIWRREGRHRSWTERGAPPMPPAWSGSCRS